MIPLTVQRKVCWSESRLRQGCNASTRCLAPGDSWVSVAMRDGVDVAIKNRPFSP